jgi:hypothetical protein
MCWPHFYSTNQYSNYNFLIYFPKFVLNSFWLNLILRKELNQFGWKNYFCDNIFISASLSLLAFSILSTNFYQLSYSLRGFLCVFQVEKMNGWVELIYVILMNRLFLKFLFFRLFLALFNPDKKMGR